MRKRVVLLTSAAYVAPEIAAEFGRLPPAFLPMGCQRLYAKQLAALAHWGMSRLCLTLPDGFEVEEYDSNLIDKHNVEILRIPEGVSLGHSIRWALAVIGEDVELRILHGDTLIEEIDPEINDVVGVAVRPDNYNWGAWPAAGGLGASVSDQTILTGFFSFASSALFVRALTLAGDNFVDALAIYARMRPLNMFQTPRWLDFGHLQTYHQSRRTVTSGRAFNSFVVSETSVRKTSEDTLKLRAEAAWFESLPVSLKPYTARYLGSEAADGQFCYETEYEFGPPLSELAVLGALDLSAWRLIGRSCESFLGECRKYRQGENTNDTLLALGPRKARQRLPPLRARGAPKLPATVRLNGKSYPNAGEILDVCEAVIAGSERVDSAPMHGDLCFSNILYDTRCRRVRLIDPRGTLDGLTPSHLGDVRYDLAKLAQSVWGLYDWIMMDRYSLSRLSTTHFELRFADQHRHAVLQKAFDELEVDKISMRDQVIWATMITLFFAMIPLHYESPQRQLAFYVNAFRLFGALEPRI